MSKFIFAFLCIAILYIMFKSVEDINANIAHKQKAAEEAAVKGDYRLLGGFNPERQRMLERYAYSANIVERRTFEKIYGRPLYNKGDFSRNLRNAIFYIASREGWEYQDISDLGMGQKPIYYSGTTWEWNTQQLMNRSREKGWVLNREEKYMKWYNKSRYSEYVPDVFPEDFESYEAYNRHVEWVYSIGNPKKDRCLQPRWQLSPDCYETEEEYFKAIKNRKLLYELAPGKNAKREVDLLDKLWYERVHRDGFTKEEAAARVYAAIFLYFDKPRRGIDIFNRLRKARGSEPLDHMRSKASKSRKTYYEQYPWFEKYRTNLNYYTVIDYMDEKKASDGKVDIDVLIRDVRQLAMGMECFAENEIDDIVACYLEMNMFI